MPGKRPVGPTGSRVQPSAAQRPQPKPAGAIDHWSIVLFYSMGVGTLTVAVLLFAVLMAVCLFAQVIWTFTPFDMAGVSLAPFRSFAYFVVAGTFVGGTCAGLWCFSGAVWKNAKPGRSSSSPIRRTAR